jgi:hypothetical protein
VAIIPYAYQQPSSVSIGKGRYRLGKLAGISHTILEILLLMLAFANQS